MEGSAKIANLRLNKLNYVRNKLLGPSVESVIFDEMCSGLSNHLEELAGEVLERRSQIEDLELELQRLNLLEENDIHEHVVMSSSSFDPPFSRTRSKDNLLEDLDPKSMPGHFNIKLGTRVRNLCDSTGCSAKECEKLLIHMLSSREYSGGSS